MAFLPEAIIFITTWDSASAGTKMCLTDALTASGGGPYSVFSNALAIPSNKPMCNFKDEVATPWADGLKATADPSSNDIHAQRDWIWGLFQPNGSPNSPTGQGNIAS
jgi:hypothetical protein